MANLVQDLKRSIQEQFQREIGYRTDFCQLFNELERVAFFLKNRRFQIVFANRVFFERLGFSEEEQIVGKDDFELFPRPLATKFRRDDESVMRTGISSPRMVELFLTRHGLPEWYVTNKRPVLNQKGQPAGVMGTVQRYDQGAPSDLPIQG
ncbi:MAG: PAS domain-containing protein [Verrucomicrobiota bacterium]